MRNAVVVGFALFVGMFVGVNFRGLRLNPCAAVGAGPAITNGDTNGDGEIDLTDAVYLLSWLFQGGPEPKPCPAAGGLRGLPETGQNVCYEFVEGQGYMQIPCDQATCKGQDGSYGTGCPSESRFVDNQDSTVTDNCTGLMWQKETVDVDGDGRSTQQDVLSWCEALAYCESLSFSGHDDWRLPSMGELLSLFYFGDSEHFIHPVFGGVFGAESWSSTSHPESPESAWYAEFQDGEFASNRKVEALILRAVRSGP